MNANMFSYILGIISATLIAAGCLVEPSQGVQTDNPELFKTVFDLDGDTVPNETDNCPGFNPDQADQDGDGVGDICDKEHDGDKIRDSRDNCPDVSNPLQEDADGDHLGDACDPDKDGDGVLNAVDNCPMIVNPLQANIDGDAFGDACDEDKDGDTILDTADNCPDIANRAQLDLDDDGQGDACEDDTDGDTVHDDVDNCVDVANTDQSNTDRELSNAGVPGVIADNIGDACDDDCDGDGVVDPLVGLWCTVQDDLLDLDHDGYCTKGTDLDHDGVCITTGEQSDTIVDCDDGTATTHPGATEDCSSLADEDCDGQINEGCGSTPVCVDLDGDGYGANCARGVDCDDNAAAKHVGATEICGDGIDQDCSGSDLACPPVDVECDENSDCVAGEEFCLVGKCKAMPVSGQCHTFAVEVARTGAGDTYMEWYGPRAGAPSLRHGDIADGTHFSETGECSAVAWDFTPGHCLCHTYFGTSPCEAMPSSGGTGCWENKPGL